MMLTLFLKIKVISSLYYLNIKMIVKYSLVGIEILLYIRMANVFVIILSTFNRQNYRNIN